MLGYVSGFQNVFYVLVFGAADMYYLFGFMLLGALPGGGLYIEIGAPGHRHLGLRHDLCLLALFGKPIEERTA